MLHYNTYLMSVDEMNDEDKQTPSTYAARPRRRPAQQMQTRAGLSEKLVCMRLCM